MKRPLKSDELKLWSVVLEDVLPGPGRARPKPPQESAEPPSAIAKAPALKPTPGKAAARAAPPMAPARIEPNRARRIAIGREIIASRLDLHGYGQDEARRALERFITAAYVEGARAVLVITGKGAGGDGVLRRRTPEWLSEPPLRAMIAGLGEARHRHGGKGALYVALRRRPAA